MNMPVLEYQHGPFFENQIMKFYFFIIFILFYNLNLNFYFRNLYLI